MTNIIQVLGNGDYATIFNKFPRPPDSKLLICNMPPFEVDNVFACVMVDFKMMAALTEGSIKLDAYDWILGNRPKMWMEDMQPGFYLKYSRNVKGFYTVVPDYAVNATNFNCGHMAVHYAANKLKADIVEMYGFDSLFDFNMRSVTDLVLPSDREDNNNHRLLDIWRPIWSNIFKEFPKTKFRLYHKHPNIKINISPNVEIRVA
jgi:hypothetical protein